MKHMKRLLSLMLTLLLVLGMSTAAFAEDAEGKDSGVTEAGTSQTQDVSEITLTKTIAKTDNSTTYPGETLKFTSVLTEISDSANNLTENRELEIDDVTVNADAKTADIKVKLPKYNSVGIYTYKIKETAGNVAGVTYYTSDIELKVYVTNGDNGNLIRTAVVTSKDEDNKKITGITNTYSAGSLSVKKSVTGNMGDKNKKFKVKVTFTVPTNQTVKSTISYVVGGVTNTIDPDDDGWTESKTVDIELNNEETVTFTNIPYGVTYTVKESDYSTDNYTTSYKVGETEVQNSDETGATGSINTGSSTVTITNNKQKEVDTGIDLDSLPYILVLAVACMGLVAFVSKKRMMREN